MCICMGCVLANRLTHITQKNGLDLLMLTFPAARSGHSPKTTTRMNLDICPLCALCLAILRTCLAYNKPLLCFSRHCLCLAISRTCCTYRMKVVPFATLSMEQAFVSYYGIRLVPYPLGRYGRSFRSILWDK